MSRRIVHIIVAAGTGSRFGGELPKQFQPLEGGRPVLMTTVGTFASRPGEEVVLVLSEVMEPLWQQMCRDNGMESPRVVYGGATRHQSVANALAAVSPFSPGDIVTVHDGARPVVTAALIDRVLAPILEGSSTAVIPAVDVTDSLRMTAPDGTSRAVDRAAFRAVQTPQAFDALTLAEAYSHPEAPAMTDDASVIEIALGGRVDMVDGDGRNIKITRPGDIEIALIHLNAISRQ